MGYPYRLVVFDWEGTLGDTLGQFINAIINEAKRMQLGEISHDTARHYLAFGPVIAVKKLFPHLPAHQQAELLQTAQSTLLTMYCDVCLMPGARELLDKLKQAGIKLAIATNKGQQSLLRHLEASELLSFFDVTRSAGQTPAKPCPQMLEEIMFDCDVQPEQTLMVGDSVNDIEMATNAQVKSVGVDFYHQNESLLRAAGASEVFDNFVQLANFLGVMA